MSTTTGLLVNRPAAQSVKPGDFYHANDPGADKWFQSDGGYWAKVGDPTSQAGFDPIGGDTATAGAAQPLNANLTAIAALTTTATGRSLLAAANAAAIRAIDGSEVAGSAATAQAAAIAAAAVYSDTIPDGQIRGYTYRPTKTATYTASMAADGNATIEDLTDGAVITLPAISAGNKGFNLRLQNSAANGAAGIQFKPNAADKIVGGVVGSGGVGAIVNSASGTTAKAIINTKATAKQGDYIILQSDGVHTWWIIGGFGVWESEA